MIEDASRVARNSFLAFGTNVSIKAVNVIAFILISRIGGVEQSGIFSLSTIYLLILSAIVIGLDELLTRQVARDRSQAKAYFRAYILARIVLGIALYTFLFLFVTFMKYSHTTFLSVLWFGMCLIPDGIAGVGQALLAAYERYGIPFYASIVAGIVKTVGTYWVLKAGYGVIEIGQVWLIGSILAMLIVLITAFRLTGGVYFPGGFLIWNMQEIRLSVPFFMMSLLAALEYQADVLILSKLQGDLALGLYSSITTITFSLALIPQAYRSAVYPFMIRLHKMNSLSMSRIYQISMVGLGTLVFPIVIGLILLSQRILVVIYSPRFLAAGPALQIIVIVLIFLFLNIPSSRILLIYEKQALVPYMWMISLIVNIILNLVLVPTYSIRGSAFARVVSEAIFFFIAQFIAMRLVGYTRSYRDLLLPVLAALLMGVIILPLREMAIWIPILVGILIYPLILITMLRFSSHDRALFWEIWLLVRRALQAGTKPLVNHNTDDEFLG